MSLRKLLLPVLGLLVLAASPVIAARADVPTHPAVSNRKLAERIDAFMGEEMRRQQVPGVALAIIKGDSVVLAKGYGYANLEHRIPVTSETIFESGSIGKQFTAAAVMLQVEDGKLSLEDPLTKYFTDAPASWRAITVRHLLTHTSGLPDYVEGDIGSRVDYRRDYTEQELAQVAYRLPLAFEPGARFSYSNTGYVLLGILVHKVSGRFYGDVLRERVFGPLGMKTARVISEADIVPSRAGGYRLVNGRLLNQEWVSPTLNTTADGSLHLSLLDCIAWSRGLRAKAILREQSWAQVHTPVRLKSGKTFPYGFGWRVDVSQGQPWYHHAGAWQGFQTYISRYEGSDLTVVILANSAAAVPATFVDGVSALIDAKLARLQPATPIADHDPQVTELARKLLVAAGEGRLTAWDLPRVRSASEQAEALFVLLGPWGPPRHLRLLERREMGDDQMFVYEVAYREHALRLQLGLAPDGSVSTFNLRPD